VTVVVVLIFLEEDAFFFEVADGRLRFALPLADASLKDDELGVGLYSDVDVEEPLERNIIVLSLLLLLLLFEVDGKSALDADFLLGFVVVVVVRAAGGDVVVVELPAGLVVVDARLGAAVLVVGVGGNSK